MSSSYYFQDQPIQSYSPNIYELKSNYNNRDVSWFDALTPKCYDGEQPLLAELGVNFSLIFKKTLVVLNPFIRFDRQLVEDDDLAGPIAFCLLLGMFLLLVYNKTNVVG